MSMAWDSQMPVSHDRSGNRGMTLLRPVPSGIAAVQVTTRSSRFMMSISASAKALVKLRPPELSATLHALTLKGFGAWNVVASPSAYS